MSFVVVARVRSYIYCSNEISPKNVICSSIHCFVEHKENIKRI